MASRGGPRSGAGRKTAYGEPTRVMRVPESKFLALKRQLAAMSVAPAEAGDGIESVASLRASLSRELFPLFLSHIPAGWPSPADDYVERQLDLNEHLVLNKAETFILKVSGSSMIQAGIFDGDEIIVDRTVTPKHGDVVVAVLNGELTVKGLWKRGKEVRLLPANPEYQEIRLHDADELEIFGVVMHVLHDPVMPWS